MPTTVQDVMTTDLVTCPTDTTLQDVAQLMREHLAIEREPQSVLGAISGAAPDRP